MQSNPLAARLTVNARWPSARIALWFALGLGVVSLALSTWTVLQAVPSFSLMAAIFIPGMAVTWLAPLVIAAAAAYRTARHTHHEEYQLMRLTDLSEAEIVWGYVLVAAHRVRVLLALVVGLMPALVVIWLVALGSLTTLGLGPGASSTEVSSAPTQREVIAMGLKITATVIAMWGGNLLGAGLGVGLGLWWRSAIVAAVFATLATFIGIVLLTALAAVAPVVVLPVGYLLGSGIVLLAQRSV
jgi:hypothetical protein